MPQIPFVHLLPESRLWVFSAERPLSPEEEGVLLVRVDSYLAGWAAHGVPLISGRDWRHDRFLFVAVDEASEPPSGCSIDALTNVLKELGAEMGLNFVDNSPVFYREGGEVRRLNRGEFKAEAVAGNVTVETEIFDNSITRLSQLRAGEWEKPAGDSWHRQAFFS